VRSKIAILRKEQRRDIISSQIKSEPTPRDSTPKSTILLNARLSTMSTTSKIDVETVLVKRKTHSLSTFPVGRNPLTERSSALSSVVAIDFAQCEFRNDESDEAWGRWQWSQDEEEYSWV
jgi:hypothetical protein